MKILIGADIVPTQSNQDYFLKGDINNLADSFIIKQLNNADYRIFNLEVPLTDEFTPIEKCGPCLRAPSGCINGIKALGADFVTLANNHIMDQGVRGLTSTINLLKRNQIAFSGVGNNLEEARRPHIIDDGTKTIGVYCCAEHEFSIASENSAGANPFDPLYSPDSISELKQKCDYVIVLYHGGKESYRYPSPELQKTCRRIAEKGADVVICQHSHCIGCSEKWAGATIVYGQGNFLFDRDYNEGWNTGMMILLDSEKPDFDITFIPIYKENGKIRKTTTEESEAVMSAFLLRGEKISSAHFVQEQYSEYAKNNSKMYYNRISGKPGRNFFVKALNKLTGSDLKKFYQKKDLLNILNILECEAHRELFSESLRSEIKRK